MPITTDPSIRGLNDCDGCEGISAATPVQVSNRPGLDRIAYRVGTHARFLESMLARLSSKEHPALRSLRTRSRDDLTIAFLDACAAVDDGLTFYTERYANEWYVRTATERVSLVQMARLIGYEPRPGVAATAYLAFTLEDSPGTPDSITIEGGTRVMSIPGKDELPQTFETSVPIEARALWNAMKLRTRQPQPVSLSMKTVIVRGLETGLKPGDRVLILVPGADNEVQSGERKVKRVLRITPDPVKNQTEIELQEPAPAAVTTTIGTVSYTLGYTTLTNDAISGFFQGKVYASSDVTALYKVQNWQEGKFVKAVNTKPKPVVGKEGVYAFRQRSAIFGHNAPNWASLPQIVEGQSRQYTGRVLDRIRTTDPSNTLADDNKWQYPHNWDEDTVVISGATDSIDLDNLYPQMTKDSWVALEKPGEDAKAFFVNDNQELTRSDYTLSVKVSRLTLESGAASSLSGFKMRRTTVFGQSEQLSLADVPIENIAFEKSLTLDQFYPGLKKGQLVIVSGERTDLRGVIDHEVRVLEDIKMRGDLEQDRFFTELVFTEALDFEYIPETVTINANVAETTHGETKTEVLGSGNGAVRYQSFTLKHPPLTYISASTPTGASSTLEVRVNDVLWLEVPSLYGREPEEPVYRVRHEDDGKTSIQFNAPLPTGQENVRATYRSGIGLPGQVRAGQLSMLPVRPLGVRGVTNPLQAIGAEDRESIEDLRENSPLTVLTLDRLVSLKDYEDFARAFAGFSKALAIFTLDGAQQGVFVTVAGETGVVDESSKPFQSLVTAIQENGDPFVSVIVKSYRQAFFQIDASVGVDPAYLPDLVLEAIREKLYEKYSFTNRRLGEPVTEVEIIADIQSVPGVVYVDLNKLYRVQPFDPDAPVVVEEVIHAEVPAPGSSRFTVEPAELLTIDETRPLQLTTVKV